MSDNERAIIPRRLRRARQAGAVLVLLVAVAAVVPGCEQSKKFAVGDRNQLILFADDANWLRYGETLTRIFEREVHTPQLEYIFRILRRPLDRWEFFTRFYHILLCAPLDEDSPTGEQVRAMLNDDVERRICSENRALALVQDDPYAVGQRIIIITADTDQNLRAYLDRAGEHLFTLAEEHLNRLTERLIYREERYALEDSLYTDYGFTVRIPWGFRTNFSRSDENFIRMIKYQVERWFFAYWIPAEEIDRRGMNWLETLAEVGRRLERDEVPDLDLVDFLGQQAMNLRDDICRRFYDGDIVARDRTTATIREINGRWAVRLYGIWENEVLVAGGPLVAYCFYDPATSRVFWLDGAVFAPNQKKEGQLRQMDVMLNTFMSGEEAASYLAGLEAEIRADR